MIHRVLTTWFPLVSLIVAMVLAGHDAVMAAGPHDPGEHGAHADHRSSERHRIPVEPDHQESPCGSFKAARTEGPTRDIEPDATVASPLVVPPPDPGTITACADESHSGAPPGQLRALLQVWLI